MPQKKGGGLFTHGDGDDRQWRLLNYVSYLILGLKVLPSQAKEGKPSDARVGGMAAFARRGVIFCGVELTEDSSWCVVTGETGLTHTRTTSQIISIIVLIVLGAPFGNFEGRWKAIGMDSISRRGRIRGGNDRDRAGLTTRPKHKPEAPGKNHSTYPLSMTRAATSSIMGYTG